MASVRRVRKNFRKEVLRLISSGDGNIQKLIESAGRHFGHDVGYEVLIKTFLQNEVSNAVSTLRNEGHIETIGKKWKPITTLEPTDVEIISLRRLKRIRGELQAQVRLSHQHGRIDDACTAGRMLETINIELMRRDKQPAVENEEALELSQREGDWDERHSERRINR
jgi:hypothetical protein